MSFQVKAPQQWLRGLSLIGGDLHLSLHYILVHLGGFRPWKKFPWLWTCCFAKFNWWSV